MQREIIIGVCGGIAAYKSANLISTLVQKGYGVTVVMTLSATRFVGASTFQALTGRSVFCETFDQTEYPLGPHIALARQADLLCIAPATANLIGKAANGIGDDLLTTLFLSFTGNLLIAPAMNCEMWAKPAVQRNLETLRADGVHFVGPENGWLACRDQGAGRMSEPEKIIAEIQHLCPLDVS